MPKRRLQLAGQSCSTCLHCASSRRDHPGAGLYQRCEHPMETGDGEHYSSFEHWCDCYEQIGDAPDCTVCLHSEQAVDYGHRVQCGLFGTKFRRHAKHCEAYEHEKFWMEKGG